MFPVRRCVRFRCLSIGVVLSMFVLSSCGAAAAPNEDPQQGLKAALLDHQFYLRGFDAARTVNWHWNGSELVPEGPSGLSTLAAFLPSHVAIKRDTVIIEGQRRSLSREGEELKLAKEAVPVKLVVTVSHDEQATVLPQLTQLLFFRSREEAIAALPSGYKDFLPAAFRGSKPTLKEKCDCADLGKPACEGKSASIGLTNPKLVRQVAPDFSDEALRAKYNGDVGLVFTLSAAGRPFDLWLTQAVGMGLDEKAAAAVRGYVFLPATCHGEPTPVPLFLDVNFQLF